ncbi:hypothetical protein ALP58_200147 [Pseudomonas savastanoi]|uniref:Uncharacterized protein n=2 Tax=Pseudomonas syringae group TaxID=136849 RepID=A0A3M5G614_PSESS|nr:hypothetical protein JN853_31180 [Pseudomonas syringae pv. actinidiae ICMP 9853]NVL62636.1 hypothetical protein [Pseudomonas syringae pv. actinidiae]RMS82095.1 hypothetical protein ALP59_200039 [Pseudomonas savastanoi]RMS52873.1 hypothetical protein ALP64_201264 [Pseudomonas syringae pv. actinidiae]RMS86103.1 hypothetical protein ALP58_200147 [Pseudomonas savastanoi]
MVSYFSKVSTASSPQHYAVQYTEQATPSPSSSKASISLVGMSKTTRNGICDRVASAMLASSDQGLMPVNLPTCKNNELINYTELLWSKSA